jgi:hypothetical protein
VIEYHFPNKAALEQANYCLFPDQLEDDDLVLFHGTLAESIAAILSEGFKSAAKLGTGCLTSVTFAYKSREALTHMQNLGGDRVIVAARYGTLDRSSISKNTTDIHDYTLDPAPTVIGYCRVPSDYGR